jgi:hypothetical protein
VTPISISASGITALLPGIAGKKICLQRHTIVNNATIATTYNFQSDVTSTIITSPKYLPAPAPYTQPAGSFYLGPVGEGLVFNQTAAGVVGLDYEACYLPG